MIKKIRKLSKKSKIALFLMVFPGMAMCSQAGWVGYYKMYTPAVYNIDVSDPGISSNWISIGDNLGLSLPRDCSGLTFAGILTPYTPPIPLPWRRSWALGGECDDFGVLTKINTKIQLKFEGKLYNPLRHNMPYGEGSKHIRYFFPIKAKNIDSGVIIIEKDGERAEVPFQYEYFKFYH